MANFNSKTFTYIAVGSLSVLLILSIFANIILLSERVTLQKNQTSNPTTSPSILPTYSTIVTATPSSKVCSFSGTELSITVPSDWTCSNQGSEQTANIRFTFSNNFFGIMTYAGFGPDNCDGPVAQGDKCEAIKFYENNLINTNLIIYNNKDDEIFGTSRDSSITISIKLKNLQDGKLNQTQTRVLKNILESIRL